MLKYLLMLSCIIFLSKGNYYFIIDITESYISYFHKFILAQTHCRSILSRFWGFITMCILCLCRTLNESFSFIMLYCVYKYIYIDCATCMYVLKIYHSPFYALYVSVSSNAIFSH